jgi:glycosyltransferase involved in cell wall biosynthesis
MVLDREFPPDIRVENEIEALIHAGHEVHIACYTRKSRPPCEKSGRLIIHRKPISGFLYKSSAASLTLPFYFRFWKKFLMQLLQNNHFDVLHVHDLPLVGPGAKLKRQFKLKLIADLHENWPAYLDISKHTNTLLGRMLSPIFLWRIYEKKILRYPDSIIVVVQEAKARLINLGIEAGKISVVSNTINLSELNLPAPEPARKEIILYYAGGLNYHRGLQNVILAMHKADNPLLVFWILGDGSYKEQLVRLVDQLGLKERVIFHGYQPFQKVMEMLSQSDFALIPHLKTEHTDSTIPHKLFQYMYAQIPVIASDCQPIKRILEETGAGIVYPSGHPDQLTDILVRLNSVRKTDLGAKGKYWVEKIYNWQNDAEVLKKTYETLKSGII